MQTKVKKTKKDLSYFPFLLASHASGSQVWFGELPFWWMMGKGHILCSVIKCTNCDGA